MTTLRLFFPDVNAEGDHLGADQTLSQFYEAFVLPQIRKPRGAKQATIEQDRVALSHWRKITGDPPLREITRDVCAKFVRELIERGLSPYTIKKTVVHLQFFLDHAGTPDRYHRNAAEILASVPYFERPRECVRDPAPSFTLQEIEVLIEACRALGNRLPRGPIWWSSLIRFAWHTGLRRSNLLNARWSWISQDGWLTVPSSYYKQSQPGRRFYLSQAALSSARLARIDGEDCMLSWGFALSYFHGMWRRIVSVLPKNRRFGLKAIRRAALTWLAERNPLVARLVAGHRRLDVLEDFYVQREVVIQLLESMPIPKGWDV